MQKPTYPLKTIVEVEWVDSVSRGRWASLADYRKQQSSRCKTCGYLVAKDRKRVIVALSQGEENMNDILDSITIPRGCVTKIRMLK